MLPLTRVELAVTFGYGVAYAWEREFISGLGAHAAASARVLFHVDGTFDLGLGAAVTGERHPGTENEVRTSWAGAPIRLIGRLRF